MKIYKIKVNGKTYKVELESIEENGASAAKVEKEAKKEEPVKAVAHTGEGQKVESPIQGSVVAIKVKPGDNVKKGDVLVIIEAMKLENEVVSPFDGVVADVLVAKGQSVAAKDVVVTIK
ncbi:MAG: biotin/lipoyl-binding protein [Bacilli bacterium]|nr:biotin/lipoyl-binding protein [Bacilli bacterium]